MAAFYQVDKMDGKKMTTLTLQESPLERVDSPAGDWIKALPKFRVAPVEDTDTDIGSDLESTNRHLRLTIQRLERLVYVDELTGLPNRRFFDSALEAEMRRAARDEVPLSLFMCDIDRFKRHNDTFGHRGGDAVLKLIAEVMQRYCRRAGDCAARYGGEEFALILPRTNATDARALAEELRNTVAELTISQRDSKELQHVTMSIGVTTFYAQGLSSSGELVDAADAALYKAKNTGRNRSCYQAFRPW
jgi:diguanylate cyclase (GGDEF)-like protein